MDSCSLSRNSRKYWKVFNDLSGKRTNQDPNQPISFHNTTHTNPQKIATHFCRQFTRPVPHTPNPDTPRLIRQIRKQHPLDRDTDTFTTAQIKRAIRDSKNSTATSPDGLTILHLRHLGPLGLQYLCRLYNLSYKHAEIPAIWKHAIIISLPKPGKPINQGTSYRPISLLCPASKVLEKLLRTLISPHIILSDSQHGFRRGRSTTSALLPLVHQIAAGFNQHYPIHRTVSMAVDFSKAFDTVNHTRLLTDIHHTTMPHNAIRWLTTYLRGRTAACKYNKFSSKSYPLHTGVPQGSVLSPLLFNLYVSSYPQTVQLSTSYADDFTASVTTGSTSEATSSLAAHAADVTRWAEDRALQVSAQKSTVTLFSSQTRELSNTHPNIPINSTPLPLEKNPQILGVTFDPTLTFSAHVENVTRRAKQRLSILKALAGTTWGQQKETLINTFKATIRSLFTYASPIWSLHASNTSIAKLQTVQNAALRVATGSVKASAQDHLHAETRVLPVREHLSLLAHQHLATCLQRTHPSYATVTADSGPRDKKGTLQRRYGARVLKYCTNGAVEDAKAARAELHTEFVDAAIRARSNNRVLNTPTPDIDEEELTLPRPYRTTLSQLRSGHCSSLNEYKYIIQSSDTASCPSCTYPLHNTHHIFSCPAHPTALGVRDLWERPARVADFLATLPFFRFKIPPRPPPVPPSHSDA